MSNNELSQYKVIFKSDPKAIDFGNLTVRSFPRIVMKSDIFKFYPYGELFFTDSAGVIIDRLFFIEGLKLNFKIGNDDLGWVGQDFYWSEDQINNVRIGNFVSGDNLFIMKSYLDRKDYKKSKSWSSKKLSEVVTEIVKKNYGITDTKKQFIKTTLGSDSWYQLNESDSQFLMRHRELAYSQDAPYSPYLTFINSNEEFYFTTVESLFSEQQPVSKLKIEFSETSTMKQDTLKSYNIMFSGNPLNKPNYKRKQYHISKDGSYSFTNDLIENHFVKFGKGTTLITKDLQTNQTSIDLLGIRESVLDEYRQNASRNFNHIDSLFPVRLECDILFNPKCVSGKLIDLTIGSSSDQKQISSELSGNWLILSDQHYLDYDGIAITHLMLGKSKTIVDVGNPFSKDFL